ncbi:hypothetical protein Bca52824_026426 [Brassica carinata]|uniref:Uncharacterized protein n=1 Tax=Brassica carinata TaxID=52824 RepID=A0A8X7SHX3_BRACI|nr:hypothetical protein Bca52824_026426 [Brassica carinata]
MFRFITTSPSSAAVVICEFTGSVLSVVSSAPLIEVASPTPLLTVTSPLTESGRDRSDQPVFELSRSVSLFAFPSSLHSLLLLRSHFVLRLYSALVFLHSIICSFIVAYSGPQATTTVSYPVVTFFTLQL